MTQLITIQPYDFPSLAVAMVEAFGQCLYYTYFIFSWRLQIAFNLISVSNINTEFNQKKDKFQVISIIIELFFSLVGSILSATVQQVLFTVFSTISAGKAIYDGYFELISPPIDENGEVKIIEMNTVFKTIRYDTVILILFLILEPLVYFSYGPNYKV